MVFRNTNNRRADKYMERLSNYHKFTRYLEKINVVKDELKLTLYNNINIVKKIEK